jgi:hypothetical protein
MSQRVTPYLNPASALMICLVVVGVVVVVVFVLGWWRW